MQVNTKLSPLTRGAVMLIALALTAASTAQSVNITPLQSIQATINSGLYDEIVLGPGTYFQTVEFFGAAITLRSTDPTDPAVVAATIIDGQFLGDSVIRCTAGEGPDTIIDGLTIINGEALNVGSSDRGGGLYINLASPTVRNCVFDSNVTTGAGGGLYANGSSSTITNCSFLGNDANIGGGIYLNQSSSIQVVGCTFDGNSSNIDGGGANCVNGSVDFADCTFSNNTCGRGGGGINATGLILTVERTAFLANDAVSWGGGVLTWLGGTTEYRNCTFISNISSNLGGAIYTNTTTDIVNCSITLNLAASGSASVFTNGFGIETNIVSSILWNNSLDTPTGNGIFQATYNIIGGGYVGAGNLDVDPLFADAVGGDLSLLPGSPAIDAGYTPAIIGQYPVDYLGQVRAVDDPDTPDTGIAALGMSVDMGAFELQAVPTPVCQGDVDGSGMVNVTDLLALLAGWGSCP
ncbi:MAG: right-handed parallel beta-helix repeat-containing protein [Planctomycetes bacterium]|nr:right-handed parallel beta-helix repeat-containing protein [Planctomycetota bacterium]